MNTYPLIESSGESAGTISVLPLGPSEPIGAGLRAVRAGLVRQIECMEQVCRIACDMDMAELTADLCAAAERMTYWIMQIDSVLLADGPPAGAA